MGWHLNGHYKRIDEYSNGLPIYVPVDNNSKEVAIWSLKQKTQSYFQYAHYSTNWVLGNYDTKTIYYVNSQDKLILGRKDKWYVFRSPYDLEEIEENVYVNIDSSYF